MPDLSYERDRLYRLVDKFLEQQAEMTWPECICEDPDHPKSTEPLNVRIITAALVVGINFELPDEGEHVFEAVLSFGESKDSWTRAGLLGAAAKNAQDRLSEE